jgi:hypothetical protein
MKIRGMHTPIAAFAPVESPLGPGTGGDGEGVPVAGGVEIMGEELVVLVVLVDADRLGDEVISIAAENAAKSELCHRIGIPSPCMLFPVAIVVVLALPGT